MRYPRLIQPCGCELTEHSEFKPCKSHWQLLHDMCTCKMLTGAEFDYEASVKLGVPIVKSCPPTWLTPKEYENLKMKIKLKGELAKQVSYKISRENILNC